jgi:hypothetical protein
MEEPTFDGRRPSLTSPASTFPLGGVGSAIWIVTLVHTGLVHPNEIPIVSTFIHGEITLIGRMKDPPPRDHREGAES